MCSAAEEQKRNKNYIHGPFLTVLILNITEQMDAGSYLQTLCSKL